MNLLLTLSLLLGGVLAYGQQPRPAGTRVVTTTRLVTTFGQLERDLIHALQQDDGGALERLLSEDFEVWTPDPPGAPTPGSVWIQNNKAASAPRVFDVRQMAVRDLKDHAVASFVLFQEAGSKPPAQFVVDVWTRSGNSWKLSERYVSPLTALAAAERKPTGKD